MKWSFSIIKVAGIDVRVHATFFLLLAFFGYVSWQSGGLPGAWAGISFILLLFLCVLLHEFGHAFAARAFGIRTPDITLLPIGGVARLERMPRNPFQELVVAIAGPAVNIVIAFVLFVVLGRFVDISEMLTVDEVGAGQILTKLMVVNIWLVVFNMIPAFPMDGGRVLRALLAMKLRHDKATFVAARVGQVIAGLFFIWGLYSGNFLILFIAVFVFMGAQQELVMARIHGAVEENATVADGMVTRFSTIPMDTPIWQAKEMAMQSMQSVFPVVDELRRCTGLVGREELLGPIRPGGEMFGIHTITKSTLQIPAERPFDEAIDLMQQNGISVAPVVNANQQLVGLVSLGHLLERARFRRT